MWGLQSSWARADFCCIHCRFLIGFLWPLWSRWPWLRLRRRNETEVVNSLTRRHFLQNGHFCHFRSKKSCKNDSVLHYFWTWCRLVTFGPEKWCSDHLFYCPKSTLPKKWNLRFWQSRFETANTKVFGRRFRWKVTWTFGPEKWCSDPLFSCLKSTLRKSGIPLFCQSRFETANTKVFGGQSRWKNHKMITCWKVCRGCSPIGVFADQKWPNGHMSIWDSKNKCIWEVKREK